jgi:uncharacterized metal-binding protein/predicted Fe-Mo cluster-binding NifX family protein
MRVAIPRFGDRVSPRYVYASEVTVADVEGTRIASQEVLDLELTDEAQFVEMLTSLDVSLLVCGGIRRDVAQDLESRGIRVIHNVAGEVEHVIAALCRGELRPGFGLQPAATASDLAAPTEELPSVDCTACAVRLCLEGGACPVKGSNGGLPWLRGEEARLYETGRDVSAESDPALCRIAELVHFGVDAGFERIGVAFCWELFREVETLVGVLRRFFDVVPVCCRALVGGATDATSVSSGDTPCNPISQARLLEQAGTDLNVIAGLCLGCDMLFTRRSAAPVTTLFVKDRLLAHNPMGAIYTRYHLQDIERQRPGHVLARPGRTP